MALLLIFMLGIGNFAAHDAVLKSRHPLLGQVGFYFHLLGGRFSLGVEFLMLLGSMLMVSQGSVGWAVFYAVYSGVNFLAAWLIVSRRV